MHPSKYIAEHDPYRIVEASVRKHLETLERRCNKGDKSGALRELTHLRNEAADLGKCNSIVREHAVRFPSISTDELERRENLVSLFVQHFDAFEKVINNSDAHQPQQKQQKHQQQQQHIHQDEALWTLSATELVIQREQDAVLDDMATTLNHLQHVGTDIHRELEEQQDALAHLDESIDSAQGALTRANDKIHRLLTQASNVKAKISVILALIAVAVGLMIALVKL